MKTKKIKPLTDEQKKIIDENIDLVFSVSDFMARKLGRRFEPDELVTYAFFGLRQSSIKFDPARGIRFSTFATWRMRGEILDGVRRELQTKRKPLELIEEYKAEKERLENKNGYQAHHIDVAESLGWSFDDEIYFKNHAILFESTLSLNMDVGRGTEFGDFVKSKRSPSRAFNQVDDMDEAEYYMSDMVSREKEILIRTSLNGERLREVADSMGLSESRVCQLRNRGLKIARMAHLDLIEKGKIDE